MTTQRETKLRILFRLLQPGCVVIASWLESFGISNNLLTYYLKSGWLKPIGRGAYKRPDDSIEWYGALNAIQIQSETQVHVGGLSALELHGYSHYFRMTNEKLHLFTPLKTILPKWFVDNSWKYELVQHQSSFLPTNLGITELEINQFKVNVSTPERAILECLLLAPQKMDLIECYHLFEGLVNLKPKLLSELLVKCNSVKVKRLFFYLAERTNHQWFQFLKMDQIDLGSGRRMLVPQGVYNAKYSISIPKELADL